MRGLPRTLTRKRAELAAERDALDKRLAEVENQIAALDFALQTLAPSWVPPPSRRAPRRTSVLPRGLITSQALRLLRNGRELSTSEIATQLAREHGISLSTKRDGQRLASAVAMALRRYEQLGVVTATGRAKNGGALVWRATAASRPELSVVRGGAP